MDNYCIENIHIKLLSKIAAAREACAQVTAMRDQLLAAGQTGEVQRYTNIIGELEHEYMLRTVHILTKYYSTADANPKLNNEYQLVISAGNFAPRIDCVLDRLGKLVAGAGINERAVVVAISYAMGINVPVSVRAKAYDVCGCGAKMVLIAETSEYLCEYCHATKRVVGVIFRDGGTVDDSTRNRCSGYEYVRHLKFWLERTQAREKKEFKDSELDSLRYCMRRDSVTPRELTVARMRGYLKECGMSDYNEHTVLIMVKLGAAPPPQLTYEEECEVLVMFVKIMALYSVVNPESSNRPYYPYFIYKIVQCIFRGNPAKLALLNYIHLQSRDTVIKNDKHFEKICELADPDDGLVYCATDPVVRY